VHAAQGGEDYWLARDGLLSLRLLTNSAGKIVSMPLYRPYGASEDAEINLSPLRFGYASMWYTPGLPFYHSVWRSYRPDVGRHLQRDPAGLTDNLNLYVYAANNPSSFFDPTGLQTQVPRRLAQKVAARALKGLKGRGKVVLGGHGGRKHAVGGWGQFVKLANSTQDRATRKAILDRLADSSKLRLPQQARKLTEAVLKAWDQVIFQHGESRLLYMKVFGRAVGREGETVFRVVVDRATGKIVTYFPSHTLKALIMAGAGALTMFEAGVAEAEVLGEQERAQFEKNNQKSGWEELNDWINPIMAIWGGQDRLWEPNVRKVQPMADKMIQQLEKENNAPLDEETRAGIRMAVSNAYTGVLPTEDVFLPDPDKQEE
jgi:RHS repeat-associated protein